MSTPEDYHGFHPRVVDELRQDEVEDRFEAMLEPISMWELRAEAIRQTGDMAAFTALCEEAIVDMDERWGFNGHNFLVIGKWRRPEIDLEIEGGEGVLVEYDGAVSFNVVEDDAFGVHQSMGFSWRKEGDDGDKPRLAMMFNAGEKTIIMPYLSLLIQSQPLALPEEISLTYVHKPEYDEARALDERIRYILELQNEIAKMYMTRPEFLNQTRKRQEKLIDSIIEPANQIITSPGIKVMLDIHARVGYERSDRSTPYGFKKVSFVPMESSSNTEFRAELLGVDILEHDIVRIGRMMGDGQFINRGAGLCMILEARFKNDDQVHRFYVPVDEAVIEEYGITFE